MKANVSFLLLGLAVLLVGCSSDTTYAAEARGQKPNLLIMGEDHDKDTVPRNSRVFKRVFAVIYQELNQKGFSVYDESAITLDNFAQGRTRRTDAELIDIARSVTRPPIDVVVLFSIYASGNDVGYTTKVRARVEGRLLNVRTGQLLDNFEVEGVPEWTAPPKCNRECILEEVGGKARIIGADLGAVLTEKLAWIVSPQGGAGESGRIMEGAYTLIFDGFTPQEVMLFEDYLVNSFTGYKRHRPTYSGARRQEIWYESSIVPGRLNRNLHRMLDETGIRGTVQFSGSQYTIKKIGLRGKATPPSSDRW